MATGQPRLGMFMLGFDQAILCMVPALMFGLVDECRAWYEKRPVPGAWSLDHCRIQAETEDANLAL
jgi:hypothetical protein